MKRSWIKRNPLKKTSFPARKSPLRSKSWKKDLGDTTDSSQKTYSTLRPKKELKSSTALSKRKGGFKKGRKTLEWEAARRKLKTAFQRAGITRCEICGIGNYLGFAHRVRRRHMIGDEIYRVALLCNKHHDEIDSMGDAHMRAAIDIIISSRSVQPFIV